MDDETKKKAAEKFASVSAGCLVFVTLFACVPPGAFVALKYIVVCWRMVGPLE